MEPVTANKSAEAVIDGPAAADAAPRPFKLTATAKPFTFNPNAKSFVFQETPAAPAVLPAPAPVTPIKRVYSHAEIFALQQPLYSGSSLVFAVDSHDLSEVLMYDPTFDYLSAGLITAVPIEQVESQVAPNGAVVGNAVEMYDMVVDADAPFGVAAPSSANTNGGPASTTSPKKSKLSPKTKKPHRRTHTQDALATNATGEQDGVAAEPATSDYESESGDDAEESDAESADDASDADADDTSADATGVVAPVAAASSHHLWVPQSSANSSASASTIDDISVSYAASQKYYYFNNTADPLNYFGGNGSMGFTQGDTPLQADRRRQRQSAYFSHFSHHGGSFSPEYDPADADYGTPQRSADRRGGRNSGTYSPPLMAQRRDLFFQQDLHLHMSNPRRSQRPSFYSSFSSFAPSGKMPDTTYTREALLEIGARDECMEKPESLPSYLSDIYREDASAKNAVDAGRNTTPSNATSAAAAANATESKRGAKNKAKRKKNKEGKEPVTTTTTRSRSNSTDGPAPSKNNNHKQPPPTKGKGKKGGARSRDASPRKGGGGKARGGHGAASTAFADSHTFDDATMADLHHCDHAWSRSTADANKVDTALVAEKTVRSVLNKLSIDKLASLSSSVLELTIDSQRVLQAIVDVLFDKSVDEPAFAALYAQFCAILAPQMPEFTTTQTTSNTSTTATDGTAPAATVTTITTTHSFRTMLLTRCYTLLMEDEDSLTNLLMRGRGPSQPAPTSLELSEKVHLLKCHQKGNLIFIGELFRHELVRASVVHLCLDMLLEEVEEPSEWDVECLCVLLGTVGSKLDAKDDDEPPQTQTKTAASKNQRQQSDAAAAAAATAASSARSTRAALVESHFRKISALSRNASLPSRFRFMLIDLLDLRARAWVPRIKKTVDPQSLQEIRTEAAAAGLATPAPPQRQHSYGAHGHLTTAGKKGGAKQAAHAAAAHLRTTMKPSHHPTMRPSPSASSFGGRTLQFGQSPVTHRSHSALDLSSAAGEASASIGSFHLPPSDSNKYVPMWKRREFGMTDGGVLPRSTSTTHTTSDEQSVTTDAAPSSAASNSAIAPTTTAISLEVLQSRLDVLVSELYSSHDLAEACLCLEELTRAHHVVDDDAERSTLMSCLVVTLFTQCVEQKTSEQRALCPGLLQDLTQRDDHLLTPSTLTRGIREWATLLVDVAIDIPHAPTHSFEALAQLVHQRSLTFEQLLQAYLTLALDENLLEKHDVATAIVEVLARVRAKLVAAEGGADAEAVDAALVDLLAPSSSSPDRPFTRLFDDDTSAAEEALRQAQVACAIPHLVTPA